MGGEEFDRGFVELLLLDLSMETGKAGGVFDLKEE